MICMPVTYSCAYYDKTIYASQRAGSATRWVLEETIRI